MSTSTTSLTTSTTPAPSTSSATTAPARPGLWKPGLLAGLVASLATTSVVLVARGAGIPMAIQDEAIPLAGFAQLTMVGAVLGILIARVLSTRARLPRRTFVAATAVLTGLSLVPDVIADASVGTRLTLGLTHLVAAAVIIPVLARRLEGRTANRL
jgi:hypothetical protein